MRSPGHRPEVSSGSGGLASTKNPISGENIFALLIGINRYLSPQIPDLKGAVADALAVKAFLIEDVGVRLDHIQELYDSQATGDNIKAAILGFAEEPSIHQDDSIFIYYAGHGSEVPNPQPISTISKIQMLIPHDFNEKDTESASVQGIFDFAFSEWLARVARIKGDNILVILDSCHSGSGTRASTRTSDDDAIRGISLSKDFHISTSMMASPDEVIDGQIRGSKAAFGFAKGGLESHVLLSACREDQTAKERHGRGLFTVALLATLQRIGHSNCTYVDLIQYLPDLGREQNPHCEGVHNDRLFLGMTTGRKTTVYKLTCQGTDYVIPAGDAVGIVADMEFAVYAEQPFGHAPPLGFLVVSRVKTTISILVPKPGLPAFIMPLPAYVHQVGSSRRVAVVSVAIQPGFFGGLNPMDVLGPKIPSEIYIIDDLKCADLVLDKTDTGVGFEILDKSSSDYGLHHTSRSKYETSEDVLALLQAVSCFYYHLRRSSKQQLLASCLDVECFEIRAPFRTSDRNLNSNGLITVVAGGPDDDEGAVPAYGFRITNNSQVHLFVAVYFFNALICHSESYYRPPVPHCTSDARPCLPPKGSLMIGYGSSGAIPREYYVDDGFDVDVGFLKVFASTEYVDYALVDQESPFDDEPLRALTKKYWIYQEPMWDSKVITIVQQKNPL